MQREPRRGKREPHTDETRTKVKTALPESRFLLKYKKPVIFMDKVSKIAGDWYSVKLLRKITISGIPEQDKIDEFFHDSKIFFEESILLVEASSFDEAYQIAKTTAQKENEVYENKYGQMVKREFYKSIDCFHLFDSPQSTMEVYSTFFLKKQSEEEQILFDKRYNHCTAEELHLLRHI